MKLGIESFTKTDLPDNVTVGNYSSIAQDCVFHSADNHLAAQNHKTVFTINWDQPSSPEPIEIGNDVWIGRGVNVLQGVKIGDGAIIGAGALIAKDVPPFAVVVGNPQVIKRYRFSKPQIKALYRIKWWGWPDAKEHKDDMKDIKGFIKKYDVKTT